MNKSALIGSVIGAAIVTTVGAVAGYRVVEASRGAEVVSVKAVSRTVSTPRQECHDEQVTHTKPVKDKDRLLGTGDGAVVGGLLGNQVGGGSGKVLATVAGVEPHPRAEREGLVDLAVAHGKAAGAREPSGAGEVPEDLVARVRGVLLLAAGERAERYAAYAAEHPGELEVRPHAVEPVGTLALILEQQDGAIERRHEGRAEQAREDREVPSEQRPFRHTADVGQRSRERRGRLRGFEQREQTLAGRGGKPAKLREDRTVHADPAA